MSEKEKTAFENELEKSMVDGTKKLFNDMVNHTPRQTDEELLEEIKNLQILFQKPANKKLRDYLIDQLVMYRLTDKKKDIDANLKFLVYRELFSIFSFLATPIKEEEKKESFE